jgi:hypothetical protein
VVDNNHPLATPPGATVCDVKVKTAESASDVGCSLGRGEQLPAELLPNQKCRSAGNLIDIPSNDPASKLSRSVDLLDDVFRARLRTASRLQQLKQDESTGQLDVANRRRSVAGLLQFAKMAVASRYRDMRSTFKAASAEWLASGDAAHNNLPTTPNNLSDARSREFLVVFRACLYQRALNRIRQTVFGPCQKFLSSFRC